MCYHHHVIGCNHNTQDYHNKQCGGIGNDVSFLEVLMGGGGVWLLGQLEGNWQRAGRDGTVG